MRSIFLRNELFGCLRVSLLQGKQLFLGLMELLPGCFQSILQFVHIFTKAHFVFPVLLNGQFLFLNNFLNFSVLGCHLFLDHPFKNSLLGGVTGSKTAYSVGELLDFGFFKEVTLGDLSEFLPQLLVLIFVPI